MTSRKYLQNGASEPMRVKFTWSALQTYFEIAESTASTEVISVLFATFAEHIDLFRVFDQREMYVISTTGDFGGGKFNTEFERATGAAFAATSIQDVVNWGLGWRQSGRLVGDLYVFEVDGFNRRFSHLSDPAAFGVDMSGLSRELSRYLSGEISMDEGIAKCGLLDLEFYIPRSLCNTGLGCSILLKEWDDFKLYKVQGGDVLELSEIPEVSYPIGKIAYAVAQHNAKDVNDLKREGVWGRGVYVTENLDFAKAEAERLGLNVYDVGLTVGFGGGIVFEMEHRTTTVCPYGTSFKNKHGDSIKALYVNIPLAADPRNALKYKGYFVSNAPLDNEFFPESTQVSILESALESAWIECGAQDYTILENWLEAVEYEEFECEEFDELIDELGSREKAERKLMQKYEHALRGAANLPSSADVHQRLSSSEKLADIAHERGFAAIKSKLGLRFDDYLCVIDPNDLNLRVTTDLSGYTGSEHAPQSSRHNPSRVKMTLYRGAPSGIRSSDELAGLGGGHMEMLGAGLYLTPDIELAEIYAHGDDDSLYTVELDIEPSKLLRVEAYDIPLNPEKVQQEGAPNVADGFLNEQVDPFYFKIGRTAYLFGIDDIDGWWDTRGLRVELEPSAHLPLSRKEREALEWVYRKDLDKWDFDDEWSAVCEDLEMDERREGDIYADVKRDYFLQKSAHPSTEMLVQGLLDVDDLYLADLSDISAITSSHGFSAVEVGGVLPYTEFLVVSGDGISLKIVSVE